MIGILSCHDKGKASRRGTIVAEVYVGAVTVEAWAKHSRKEVFCYCSRLISALAAVSSACNCFTIGMFRSDVMDNFSNKAKIYRKCWKGKKELA